MKPVTIATHPCQQRLAPRSKWRVPAFDGRSAENRFKKRFRSALTAHLGGTVSVAQSVLIDAAAELALQIEAMTQRREKNGSLSTHDAREFIAFQNALRRHIVALGLKGASASPPTLMEYLATKPKTEPAAA